MGEVEEGKERINGDGRRLDLRGEHTAQCTDDVLWNYAPGTCIILLTIVIPINSTKRKKPNAANMNLGCNT